MKQNKCIILTHQNALDSAGGGTLSCVQIANHLQKMNVDVILVPRESKSQQHLLTTSVPVIPAPINQFHYLLNGLSVETIIKNIIAERPVDAVISWDYEAAFLLKMLRSQGITFGMIAAEPSYQDWANRQTSLSSVKQISDDWFRWRLLRQADVVYVSSDFTSQEIQSLFDINASKIVKTGRGIDERFKQIKRSFSGEISNFIFYGSWKPIKGIFDLIAALGQVSVQGKNNWKLKIAGWGDEQAVKEALVKHNIESKVEILGRLSLEELVPHLEWADLAILPSRAESFGRAIAEAQAAMLPVISYEVGSIPEVVEKNVTGYLVPATDISSLASSILTAIDSPEQTFAMGVKGRDRVTQLFTWERTAKAILDGIDLAKKQHTSNQKNSISSIATS